MDREALAKVLTEAAIEGNTEIVRFIVQSRVNPKTMYSHSCNALMAATAEGNIEIVRLLLQAGANVNATDYTGETPH